MGISQSLIDRINVLARKSKKEGLTEEEKIEQQQLRKEYLAAFRANFTAQLENIEFVEADGSITPAKSRKHKKDVMH